MKLSGLITVPFHIGDFLSGTLHMDATEKGAYIMLLFAHYQVGEQGLPDDPKKLSRIAGVSLKIWSRISATVSEKFTISGGFWTHKRVLDVLRRVHDNSSKQRDKALKRHNSDGATAKPQHSQPKPKPKPVDTNVSTINDDLALSTVEIGMAFQKFWNAYPGRGKNGMTGASFKGARKKALDSFTKIMKKDGVSKNEEIIRSCREYDEFLDRTGGISKHATTWLNQQCWEDDYSITNGGGGTTDDKLRNRVNDTARLIGDLRGT